jgi:hypothetical protein
MQVHRTLCAALVSGLLLPSVGRAQGGMSNAQFIKLAESGAPADIAAKAAIVRMDAKTKTGAELRAGTNGFTCSVVPDESYAPFCGDKNAWAWFAAAFTGQPKPTNTEPGISYMMQGGVHYENANGDIVMEKTASTKDVKEPPHWMLMWPIDPAASGLPAKPNAAGVYVMFAGTPYAHLMVYQNPGAMKP